MTEDLVCDFCGSRREVQAYPEWAGIPPHNKCRVCSRLLGTNVTQVASNRDVMLAIVALFHTLDLTPWDSDQEIPIEL